MKKYVIEHAGHAIATFNTQQEADNFFIRYISGGSKSDAEKGIIFTNEVYFQYYNWLDENNWDYEALAEYHGYNIPINGVSDWLMEYEKED